MKLFAYSLFVTVQ